MNATLYKGAFFKVMILMFLILIMFLLAISAKKKQEETEAGIHNGNVAVSITWPNGDTDVDLWVMGPGELVPVGYSNMGGLKWNLVRDDLGSKNDPVDTNFETAYERGVATGEYTVNVHCYRCNIVPVPVRVEVRVNRFVINTVYPQGHWEGKTIFTGNVILKQAGQERTAVNFRMDKDGNIQTETMNNVYHPLRDIKGK